MPIAEHMNHLWRQCRRLPTLGEDDDLFAALEVGFAWRAMLRGDDYRDGVAPRTDW
jgi:hypothetical protein